MLGIDSKPFINLDPYVDIELLTSIEMKAEIAKGIVLADKLKQDFAIANYGTGQYLCMNKLHKYLEQETNQVISDAVESLDYNQQVDFYKFFVKDYNRLDIIHLHKANNQVTWNNLHERHMASECSEVKHNKKLFPLLMQFIESLPFVEIGRIIMIVNNEGAYTPIHTDAGDTLPVDKSITKLCGSLEKHNHDFMLLRTDRGKELFMYDPAKDEKIYIPGYVNFFNDMDFHGSEPVQNIAYSIRVDGKFTMDFKKQLGIDHLEYYPGDKKL